MTCPTLSFTGLSTRDLADAAGERRPWLWQGFLAPGNVTLLTSRWKAGKTTLVALLLARLNGGGTLAGLPVRPGRAAIITEEGPAHWDERGRRLAFGDGHRWYCRPFAARPRPAEWLALCDHLLEQHAADRLDLLVIDPLAAFLPSPTENDAACVLEALVPLQRFTSRDVSVLLTHHPRKQASPAGLAARGSGALSGFADILLELYLGDPAALEDRRRRLVGFSRHDATPRELLLELTEDGTDYRVVPRDDPAADAFEESWQPVRLLLENAAHKLTRQQVLDRWPDDFPRPAEVTLWRLLKRAAAAGRVRCEGTGRQNEPLRYWLAEREQVWRDLYGPDWETLPDAVKATLYFRETLLNAPEARPPNRAEGFWPAPDHHPSNHRDTEDTEKQTEERVRAK